MVKKFSDIFKKSMNDPRKKKSWQSMIGISIFTLFVLSSIVVNESVQALNKAAGNYGYYGGTYGYGGSSNSSRATSDALPSAPTALSTSSITSTTGTVSWTAPTTTTVGTLIAAATDGASNGSIGRYLINYSTSTLTGCSGGTSTESTSASIALTGLTANTAYSFAVCAEDNNLNNSSALIGSFTTAAATSGTSAVASGGGGGGTPGPTYPTGTTTTTTTTGTGTGTVATGPAPATTTTSVTQSATEFGVTLSAGETATAAGFVANGTTVATVALGSGERLALVRDQLETLGRVNVTALEQLANGQKPTVRNLPKEQAQLGKVINVFVKLVGHRPNFQNAKEDLAWNTMMYRVRFKRDLNKERAGITKFKAVFGRIPTSPLDWASVRAYGYALR